MAGMMAMPVNMAKILAAQLAAQTQAINANTDSKTGEVITTVGTKAGETQSLVNTAVSAVGQAVDTETQEIDNKLAQMTTVGGELDTNVTAINNHTTAETDEVANQLTAHVTAEADRVLGSAPEPVLPMVFVNHNYLYQAYGTGNYTRTNDSFWTLWQDSVANGRHGSYADMVNNTNWQTLLDATSANGQGRFYGLLSPAIKAGHSLELRITINGKADTFSVTNTQGGIASLVMGRLAHDVAGYEGDIYRARLRFPGELAGPGEVKPFATLKVEMRAVNELAVAEVYGARCGLRYSLM